MTANILKRYRLFIVSLIILLIITIFKRDLGFSISGIAWSSFKQMIAVLPPIMILLGLIDVWVPRESMMRYMGDNSGILGIGLAILIGSIAAGPMYAAFPFTTVLLKKGVKFSNVMIFMNAWCVTKISTVMFEIAALGYKFTIVRLLVDLPGIIVMGYLISWMIPKDEMEKVYLNAEKL